MVSELPGVFSWLCDGFLLPAARNRGAASEVASRSAIAQFNFPYTLLKSTFETFSSKLRHAAAADDIVRPAARGFSSTLKSLGLSARLCAVETAFSAALRSFS